MYLGESYLNKSDDERNVEIFATLVFSDQINL